MERFDHRRPRLEAMSRDRLSAVLAAAGNHEPKALTLWTLNALVRAGRIRGERQPDGPYNRWYLTGEGHRDA